MNSKKKILGLVLVVLTLVTLLAASFGIAGCAKPESTPAPGSTPTTPKHLTIGSIMPISGPISVVGMAWTRGYELFFDKVNEEGGVKIGNERYLIDFIAEDEKSNPEAAATAAQKLISQDGATFIFGQLTGGQISQAIYEVCAPKGVLYLISWMGLLEDPGDVSKDKPLTIRPCISPDDSFDPLYDYLVKAYPNVKTIAIANPDLGSNVILDMIKSKSVEYGLEVTAIETWTWGTTDFIPLFTKLLAAKPDVIISPVGGQGGQQVIQARQLGFKGPFISTSPLGPDVFLAVAGVEGSTDVICAGWDPTNATGALKEIVDRWNSKYGGEPFVSDSALAWDEAWILVQAMEKAQSVDPKKVFDIFETMTEPGSLQTSFGPGRMAGIQTYGVNRVLERPIPISHIVNGKVETEFVTIEVK